MAVDFLGALGAGSDIDSKSLVESLVAAERQPKESALNSRIDKAEVQISAYGEVASALGTLTSIFEGLNDASDFSASYGVVSGNLAADGSDAFAIEVDPTSTPDVVTSISVASVARRERWASSGIEATDLVLNGGATFDLKVTYPAETVQSSDIDTASDQITWAGHGLSTGDAVVYDSNSGAVAGGLTDKSTYFVIVVDSDTFQLAASSADASAGTAVDLTDSGNDSQTFAETKTIPVSAGAGLTEVADAVNSAEIGLEASIVDTGASNSGRYVLSVQGALGADAAFSLSTTASSGVTPSFSRSQAAADASLTVNGISVSRASNTISDLIDGVTINVRGQTVGTGQVSILRNTDSVENQLRGLVDAYNVMETAFDDLADPDSSAALGGVFSGDSSFRLIRDSVRSIFLNPSSTGTENLNYLSDVGISFTRDGRLTIDETRLTEALSDKFDNLITMLSADTNNQSSFGQASRGIAGDAIVKLDGLLARDGVVLTQTGGLESRIDDYQDQLAELDRKMSSIYDRYLKQFTAMETAIDEMNNLRDYLKQQLSALPFNNQNK